MSVLNAAGICRRLGTPSFCRSASQCAFAVRGEMPSRRPTSSFEQPSAINPTTCSCRSRKGGRPAVRGRAHGGARYVRAVGAGYRPMGVFAGLRPERRGTRPGRSSPRARARSPRRAPSCVERAGAEQELELVAEVRPHHLRPVRRDREADAVLDERAEDVADRVLVGQRLRQQVRGRADLEHDLACRAARASAPASPAARMPWPIRSGRSTSSTSPISSRPKSPPSSPTWIVTPEAGRARLLDHRLHRPVVEARVPGTRPGDVDADDRRATPTRSPSRR